MDETVPEPAKKHRGWPKGKPRKPAAPMFVAAPEPEAPIFVRIRLKNYPVPVEFGCAEHSVENGFHVFTYPSERDRYRTTRREFAISEIIEIEITAARHQIETYSVPMPQRREETNTAAAGTGPRIHSVKDNARQILGEGSIKMDTIPNLTFGDSIE